MIRKTILAIPAVIVALHGSAAPTSAQQVVRLPGADVPLSARFHPLFAVGRENGREWESFAGIGDVAFDSRENLYVLDRGNGRVVAFDSTGRFLRVFGGEGNGPGEFTAAQRMAVTRTDELVVSDIARGTFSVFGVDGTFRRTVPFPQGTLMKGDKLAAHSQGGVVSYFIPAGGSVGGRVLWQPLGGTGATALFVARPGAPRERPLLFSPTTRYAVLPGGGLAVATSEAYSVRILAPNGSVSRVVERPLAPRRVTERDREQERALRAAFSRPGGITIQGPGAGSLPPSVRAQAAEAFQNVEFASVMPVIQAVETDAAGNLLVQRAGAALDRPGPIDVLTPQGRYVGTLAARPLPTAFSRRGRAAYVETDALGVQRVVVVRLPARWQ